MERERENHQHPSYAMIGFSRVSSSGSHKFFGSDLPVSNYIELTIQGGELDRDLTDDRYHAAHPRNIVAKVQMTPNQWAEMLMGGNIGDGVPCTLIEVDNRDIPQINNEVENRKEYTHRMFKKRMMEFSKSLLAKKTQIETITNKKTLSKDDQDQIKNLTAWVIQEVNSNIPFFMECFQETMDKVVLEAKTEVEAAILGKAMHYGLQVLNGEIKVLGIEGKKD